MNENNSDWTVKVSRMDEFIKSLKYEQFASQRESLIIVGCAGFNPYDYPDLEACPVPLVSDITSSTIVSSKEIIKIEKVIDVAFRYLMQLEFHGASVVMGDGAHSKLETEKSVQDQIVMASSLQHQVISSRIALECFFELISVCATGQRSNGSSKFKSYRKLITENRSPYNKFCPLILAGWRFDRMLRTPEVHGTSRLPYAVLNSNLDDNILWKLRFTLTNALSMSWGTLLDILNEREGGMWTSTADSDIATEISILSETDSDELEKYLKSVFKERMEGSAT